MNGPPSRSLEVKRFTTISTLLAALALPFTGTSDVRAVAPLPAEFDGVDVRNKLGEKVDRDIPLVDRQGRTVSLGQALSGDKPVLLTLNYYRCTSMCSIQLNDLMETIAQSGWLPGEQPFRVVTVSFDPTDTSLVADGKRQTYTRELVRAYLETRDEEATETEIARRAEALDWEFYVAREKSIRALSESLGYYFRYEPETQQYAHSPVTYVMRSDGTINRYLFGMKILPRDMTFALMETSDGQLGSFGEKILLSCFAFDEEHGGYGAFAWGIMRIGASGVAAILGIFLIRQWRRERARRQLAAV
jgi:protein SCO1/2